VVLENQVMNSPQFDKSVRHPWCYLHFGSHELGEFLDDGHSDLHWIKCNPLENHSIPSALVYFIEIKSLDKLRLNVILELYKHYKDAHIYIFAPKDLLQSSLCRYALHVKAKALNSLPVESKAFKALTKNALTQSISEMRQKELIHIMNLWQEQLPFVYYKDNKPQWQSTSSKVFFGSHDAMPPFENFVNDGVIVLEDANQRKWKSFSHTIYDKNESTVCFFPMEEVGNENSNLHLKHRFETIEWLKDELVFNQERLSLKIVLMHLTNNAMVLNQMDYLAHHDWLKELLALMQTKMSPFDFFAQWSESHYIICYDNLGDCQDKIIEFFEQLSDYDPEIKPIFEVSIFTRDNPSLENIIDTIDALCEDRLSVSQIQKLGITQIHSEDDDLSESEKIFRLLYASMNSKSSLKLQNIYKGLCINTASKVMGEKDGMLYLECQLIQGYAASEARNVTILGDMFPYDIYANVKLIDLEKRFIIVDDFSYLHSSANSRQYTRVQTRVRTPIAVKQYRKGIQGEIVDISLKSVALTTRQSLESFKQNAAAQYEFRLPDETKEEGYCTIRGIGEITYLKNVDMHENKLVVMLNLKSPYDADLLRYMYMRQKELIGELKALSKTRS
jgi:hypothetical protein